VYRLAAPQADHYFFINDGEPAVTRLASTRYSYMRYTDALTGEVVDAKAIALEGYSGRWIRAEK
jgi:beta-galactosidase